jgi:eukaryotic-like serine/threonine-protein kinase
MEASADRRLVAGRYVLGGPLGRGGMGTVWRADDVLLGRSVAVKEVELPGGPGGGPPALRERALREARAAARLNHPGVVTLHDVIEADGRLFLVMELVEAPTLRDLVDRSGPVPPAAAARVGLALLDALDAAHRAGIVHHDVKPANVMVASDGRVKLADFGIASLQEDTQRTLTAGGGPGDPGAPARDDGAGSEAGGPERRAGAAGGPRAQGPDRAMTAVFGSLPYVAPEQARGERAGPAADLWALGATLWFAVEGVAPFERAGPAATLAAVLNDPPGRPARAGPLEPVLLALLTKDPGTRPEAAAVRGMLTPAAAGSLGPTVPPAADPVGPTLPTAAGPSVPTLPTAAGLPASTVPTAGTTSLPTTGAARPPTAGATLSSSAGTARPPTAGSARPPTTGPALPPTAGTTHLPSDPAAATEVLAGTTPPPGWGEPRPAPRGRRPRGRVQLPGWTAPPRRRRRWGRRLLVAAGVLALLAVASNLGDAEQRAGNAPAGLGDPVRDGQFEFVVRSVDCGAASVGRDLAPKTAQDQFCLVALEVENTGTEGRTFGGGQQFLFDTDGNRHDPDLDATARHEGDARLWSSHLNPGQRLEGTLVYDVPESVTPSRVELHDGPLSGGAIVEVA